MPDCDAGEATLLLDGTDIEDLVENVEGPITWPYAGWTQRGDLPQFPGVDGAAFVPQPYDTSVLPIQVGLNSPECSDAGDQGSQLRDSLNALRVACKPDRLITLTRLWPDTTSETVAAKFLNITPARPMKDIVQCLVEFTLLSLWYGATVSGVAASGTVTVTGETRTHRIFITLPAGAARTVTNTTNGHAVTFSATVPTGGILIDVEARTAKAIVGGADYSGFLSWTKFYPMTLDPGSNTFTVSAVSASLAYQPAYL